MDPKRNETGRIEAFSDAIFAFAITLLILDIKVPHGADSNTGLWSALVEQWPTFAAYLTSFATIGIMWMNHHYLFTVIRRVDHSLILLNGLLLLTVTFTPFPTAMVAEYFNHPGEHLAAAVFSGLFVMIAILFNVLWHHASKDNLLIGDGIPDSLVKEITRAYRFGPIFYLVAFAFAWVSAPVSIGICFALAIYFALPRKQRV
jgi:uncharacterized membrane protein